MLLNISLNPRPNSAATPTIRAVLFDLDDTLWPVMPVIVAAEQALHAWLQQHAPQVAQRHSIASLRLRRQALMASDARYRIDLVGLRAAVLTEAFIDSDADPRHIDSAMALFAAARNRVTPFDDVIPALQRLARKFRLGSISNGAADLEAIGLAHHFQFSVSAHQFGSAKPDAAIFSHACAALGVTPAEAVYVGDDPELDVLGAQRAGLRSVWINRFERDLPLGIEPDASCRTLNELEAWLQSRIPVAIPGA